MHGVKALVFFDVMWNSPFASQANITIKANYYFPEISLWWQRKHKKSYSRDDHVITYKKFQFLWPGISESCWFCSQGNKVSSLASESVGLCRYCLSLQSFFMCYSDGVKILLMEKFIGWRTYHFLGQKTSYGCCSKFYKNPKKGLLTLILITKLSNKFNTPQLLSSIYFHWPLINKCEFSIYCMPWNKLSCYAWLWVISRLIINYFLSSHCYKAAEISWFIFFILVIIWIAWRGPWLKISCAMN